jgi:hypothetical protein
MDRKRNSLYYVACRRVKTFRGRMLGPDGKASDSQSVVEQPSLPNTLFSEAVIQCNIELERSFCNVTRPTAKHLGMHVNIRLNKL